MGLIILETSVHGVKNLGSQVNDESQETLENEAVHRAALAKLPTEFSHASNQSCTTGSHPDELHQLTKSKEIICYYFMLLSLEIVSYTTMDDWYVAL